MNSLKKRVMLVVSALALVGIATLVSSPDVLADSSGKAQFLIMSHHTKETCLADLDAVLAEKPKLLEEMEWGCMSGDHSGYLIVEAANEEAAREMLPSSLQDDAKIVQLNKFTADQIRSFHMK